MDDVNYETIRPPTCPSRRGARRASSRQSACATQRVHHVAPFIHRHVAVMPDVHAGRGAPRHRDRDQGAIIPRCRRRSTSACRHDGACEQVFAANDLRQSCPLRRRSNGRSARALGATVARHRGAVEQSAECGADRVACAARSVRSDHREAPKIMRLRTTRARSHSLCSSAPGTIFIEAVSRRERHVWVMLHSGSRGVGNSFGTYFISRAKERWCRTHVHLVRQGPRVPVRRHRGVRRTTADAVEWAADYARLNRELMMEPRARGHYASAATCRRSSPAKEAVNCHHNTSRASVTSART